MFWERESEKGKEVKRVKRILVILALALIVATVMATGAMQASAKSVTTFNPPPGESEVHAGNSENSKVKTCTSGKSSNETECG